MVLKGKFLIRWKYVISQRLVKNEIQRTSDFIVYFAKHLVTNTVRTTRENLYVSINESLSELKNTNFKQYWKTIKMLIKGE
jgi:hypothetical protein